MTPPLDGEPQALVRVIVATLLALPAGWEREWRRRPAGLRTHMLVGAGTAAFVVIGELFSVSYAGIDAVEVDPARTIQAVAVGVGFLGAGTIFLSGGRVRGLTTAASIWTTSAIGAAAGAGYFVLAAGLTTLAVALLAGVGVIDRCWRRARRGGALRSRDATNSERG